MARVADDSDGVDPIGDGNSLALALPPVFLELVIARVAERLSAEREAAVSPWLDVRGAAERLCCPRSRIYALVAARRIPHHRDGSRLLFRPDELDAWVRNGGAKRP